MPTSGSGCWGSKDASADVVARDRIGPAFPASAIIRVVMIGPLYGCGRRFVWGVSINAGRVLDTVSRVACNCDILLNEFRFQWGV